MDDDRPELIGIGYWYSDREPHLPHPRKFQDPNWDEAEKQMVLKHLKCAQPAIRWRGFSSCRFECGVAWEKMGSMCMTDGNFIFPEGLVHYIEEDDVRLPQEFVDHVKSYEEQADLDYTKVFPKNNLGWWCQASLKK